MPLKLLDSTLIPLRDKLVDERGYLAESWVAWFGRIPSTLAAIPDILNTVTLSAQAASITATDFSGTTLLAGTYEVGYYARISVPDGAASSLIVTIGWTDGGVAQSYAGAAIVGNTTGSNQSGYLLIRCDGATTVTYATTRVSGGDDAMRYSLDLVIKKVRV